MNLPHSRVAIVASLLAFFGCSSSSGENAAPAAPNGGSPSDDHGGDGAAGVPGDDAGSNGGADAGGGGQDGGGPDARSDGGTSTSPGCTTLSTKARGLDGTLIAGVYQCADVVYDTAVNVPEVMLDLYVPPGFVPGTRAPAIIFMHGGGWFSGSKAEVGAKQLEYLKSGYFVVSLSYRLSGFRPTPHPVNMTSGAPPSNATVIQDVKTAIQFVRANYSGFIDTDKLVAWGFSAGAHLAVLTAATSNDEPTHPELRGRSPGQESSAVAAVVAQSAMLDPDAFVANPMPVCGSLAQNPALCGTAANPIPGKCVTDPQCVGAACKFGDQYSTLGAPAITQMLGAPIAVPPTGVTSTVSPLGFIDERDPPMYLLAGLCDCTNPPIQIQTFGPAANARGGHVTLKIVETAGHQETLDEPENPGGNATVKAWLVSQGFPDHVP